MFAVGGHGTLKEHFTYRKIIEWTIPDFFQLPDQIGYSVTSATFIYFPFKCNFIAWPNGTKDLPGIVKLELKGIGTIGADNWTLEVRRTDGTVLRKCGGWKKDYSEVQMDIFMPVEEVQTGCSDDGSFRVICTLLYDDDLWHPQIKRCKDSDSQTEATSRLDELSCDLEELFIKEYDSNVVIRVDDEEFKAHKNILAVRTPVFTSMFKHEMSENVTNLVEIADCDAVTFQEFLRYLYSGKLDKFSPNSVFNLHKIADKYQVNDLKAYCLEYIKNNLSVNMFCDALILSLQYDEEELMDIATKFLSQNMTEIRDTEEWQNFSSDNPSESNKLLLEALELQKQKVQHIQNPPKRLSWFHFFKKKNLNLCVAGTIEGIHSVPRIVEWTIPNFFQLPEKSGFSISSPTFKFRQYRCRFVALPNGTKSSRGIVMFMLKGVGKTGVTRWEMEVRRTDDTVLRKCGGWKKDGFEVKMDMFIPFCDVQKGYYKRFLRVKATLYSDETLIFHEKEESYATTGSQTEATSGTDKLSYDLEELFFRGDESDVTIRIEGEEFKAHKSILRTRAPYFASMFKYKMAKNITNIVDIDDCDAITFGEFLRYIYSGKVEKTSLNSIFRLFEVANKYRVIELKAYCVEYIKSNLSIDIICDAIKMSLLYNEKEFINLVIKFLSENLTEIKNTKKWQNFSSENPLVTERLLPEVLEL